MNRIKELCEQSKTSQSRLSKVIGVSQPAISTWFLNKRDPNGKNLEKCANYFNVSKDYILCLNENPAQTTEDPPVESQVDVPETVDTLSPTTPEHDDSVSNMSPPPRDNAHEVAVASLEGLTHDELLQVIGFITVVKASRTL